MTEAGEAKNHEDGEIDVKKVLMLSMVFTVIMSSKLLWRNRNRKGINDTRMTRGLRRYGECQLSKMKIYFFLPVTERFGISDFLYTFQIKF